MMRVLPKLVWGLVAVSLLPTHSLSAYCSRCVKIEGDRAKEQAEHPQTVGYYEEVSLHSTSDRADKSKTTPSSEVPGALSGSTYRSSTEKSSQTPSEDAASSSDTLKTPSTNLLAANFLAVASLAQNASSQQSRGQFSQSLKAPADANERPLEEDFFEENFEGNPRKATKETFGTQPKQSKNGYFTDVHGHSVPYSAYSTLYTLLKTKHFLETLDGSFTLFIPTNQALSQLPPGTLANLTTSENQETLAALVSNHVVARKILKKDFETRSNFEIKALSGKNLTLKSEGGKLTIDGIEILRIEPAGYDGVIYVIDGVLNH